MDKKMPLLWIEWVDSCSTGGFWSDRRGAVEENLSVTSIGWLVDENESSITVAGHLGHAYNSVAGHVTIPKVAITGRWEITL